MRILILGGTGFIGPYHVRAAHACGHKVSVFNRGKAQADLPQGIEHLVGDRNDNFDSIKNRDWDAVLDLSTYVPRWVRKLGEAMRNRVGHYTFISTIATYDHPENNQTTTEDSPVLEYHDHTEPYSLSGPKDRYEYGALKVLCEREAEKQFPAKALVLRPGYITGPGDRNPALAYLLARLEKGGEFLLAGDRSMPVQFIDVRDMADWAVRSIEMQTTGTFNVVGPALPTTFDQLLGAALEVTSSSAMVTWVPSSWLANREDRAIWQKVLFWPLETDEGWGGGVMRMSNTRALAHGLAPRPVKDSLADIFNWYKLQTTQQQDELVLSQYTTRGAGFDKTTLSWSTYLAAERTALNRWHAHHNA